MIGRKTLAEIISVTMARCGAQFAPDAAERALIAAIAAAERATWRTVRGEVITAIGDSLRTSMRASQKVA